MKTLAGVVVLLVLLTFAFDSCDGSDTGPSEPGGTSRCEELKQWYAENPGDSNRAIAKDYALFCGEVPPPVLSGELSMDDIR